MAIRLVKTACTLNYEAQRKLENETGIRLVRPTIRLDQDGEVICSCTPPEHIGLFYIEKDETSHVGRVVAIEVDYGVRIMSDVWANLTFAVVYEPTGVPTGVASTTTDWSAPREEGAPLPTIRCRPCGYFRRIQVGNSDNVGSSGSSDGLLTYSVDADADLVEIYEAYKRGQSWKKALNAYDAQQEEILACRRTIDNGKWVRVVKGRKVKVGTEGLVFWLGDSQWGMKVGLAIPQEDGTFRTTKKVGRYGKIFENYADVKWTYEQNCKVITGPGGREYY